MAVDNLDVEKTEQMVLTLPTVKNTDFHCKNRNKKKSDLCLDVNVLQTKSGLKKC